MSNVLSLLTVAALAATPGTDLEPGPGWRSVPENSQLQYVATFEGAPAPGEFRRFEVCMEFEPARPQNGRLEVRVDVTSADMGNADVNEAIAEPEWFDFAAFPRASFSSDQIENTGASAFVARGTLTLKGVQREIDVPFTWQEGHEGPVMKGELVLKRRHFDIGTGEWAEDDSIGFDVTVRFSVMLEALP